MATIENGNSHDGVQISSDNWDESFRYAIKPAIFTAQIFGLFPYQNMHSGDISKIRFSWKSFRVLYSLLLFLYCLSSAILKSCTNFLRGPIRPSKFNGPMFYLSALTACILFHRIKWRRFIAKWCRVESNFFNEKYKTPPSSWTLKQKIHFCIAIGFIASLMNIILRISSEANRIAFMSHECNWTNHDYLEDYNSKHLEHFFTFIPYHHVLGLILEYGNFVATFYWSFIDIFITVVSLGISYRFEQINQRIDYLKGRVVSNDRWNEVRLHFVEVCELLSFVDDTLNKMIFVASLNNSYLILVQFLAIFGSYPLELGRIYYFYSLTFLITRTVVMFLVSSTIHENSKRPMKVLKSIPFEGWCEEVGEYFIHGNFLANFIIFYFSISLEKTERFFDQVRNETNALTGMGFFNLTRKVLFGLIGTIFTLELILLQYDRVDLKKSNRWFLCDK